MPAAIELDAYSHECSSAGFWPGGQGVDYPAFYSYASPSPPGFASAAICPAQAFWNSNLNQYNLPYDAVRTADDPEQALMDFLMSTYEAAASAGKWNRTAVESPLGLPGVPRKVVWD
jgi:hypothetical protein